jgi:acetate kinase
VGHRVVHGGAKYVRQTVITPDVLKDLRELSPFDPEHLPAEIKLAEIFQASFSDVSHVACFDTAFHHDIPRAAQIVPIPRRYESKGIRRYGFHGLSYTYLMDELKHRGGERAALGRVVLAHLGNGASLAAVRDGRAADTSMGFTPTSGIPMSTRAGDLDPGLVWYLVRTENMSSERFNWMVNEESGLLGISETSSDMRDLLERESADERCAEAVAVFCYQVKRWIGGFAATLGGLDTLIFSGGIGEQSPVIRERVCDRLEFLGIQIDEARNRENAEVISSSSSTVTVRVIPTDEQVVMARMVAELLNRDKQVGRN